MTDRSRIPVTMDGIDYFSARAALMKVGMTKPERHLIRRELRATGRAKFTDHKGRRHAIEKREE